MYLRRKVDAFLEEWIADPARKPLIMMALFAASLAMMRQEGVVMTAILIITLSVLSGYSGTDPIGSTDDAPVAGVSYDGAAVAAGAP